MTIYSEIAKMLRENTGIAMCDSGGDSGRHWQRNKGKKFINQAEATVAFRTYAATESYPHARLDILFQVSVFHFLCRKLATAPAMNRHLKAHAAKHPNECGLQIAESFPEYYAEATGAEATGIYGDGKPVIVNTYNGSDALTQTLQFVYFEIGKQDAYVALQIHNGADARGGYTEPRIFEVTEELGIFDNAKGSIYCNNPECESAWETDDGGCRWGASDTGANLEAYDHEQGSEGVEGKIIVTEEHGAFCPVCGKGNLKASMY